MNEHEEKLTQYITKNNIECEHLSFNVSCHSVSEAAIAVNANEKEFVKNICMVSTEDQLIVCIVKGEDRASTSRVAKALNIEKPRIASPEEILERTGYPCGGTPSFGYNAIFLIDPNVLKTEIIYSGGGSQQSLVKINSKELLQANKGQVVRVRK